MKIPLSLIHADGSFPQAEYEKTVQNNVIAYRDDDWEAKAWLVQEFMPLLMYLSKKRASEVPLINRYIEAGKEGLFHAARRYRTAHRTKFIIFALSHIEKAMDKVNRPSLVARFLGNES